MELRLQQQYRLRKKVTIDFRVHTFLASRINSQQLPAASYLRHIGHHVKVWHHPWLLPQNADACHAAALVYEGNTKSLCRHVQRSNRSWLQRTMLWRTSTKPGRSKVLNMTEKTFSIPLVWSHLTSRSLVEVQEPATVQLGPENDISRKTKKQLLKWICSPFFFAQLRHEIHICEIFPFVGCCHRSLAQKQLTSR